MSTPPEAANPYAPVEIPSDSIVAAPLPAKPLSPPWVVLKWLVVCSVSAAPSFFFGFMVSEGKWFPMLLGILVFIVGYSCADLLTQKMPWRSNSISKWTLRIGYGSRIFASVVFPIGLYLDAIVGMISMGLTGANLEGPGDMSYLGVFLTTVVQGVLLNLLLGVYMCVVLVIVWAIHNHRRGAA